MERTLGVAAAVALILAGATMVVMLATVVQYRDEIAGCEERGPNVEQRG